MKNEKKVEKYLERMCLQGKITQEHAEEVKTVILSIIKDTEVSIGKKLNKALNKYSKPVHEGGLDYVKAFEEIEKLELNLLKNKYETI